MSRVFRSSVSLILSLGIAGQVKAAGYTLTTLNVPGASSTIASGINNSGQIVGQYSNTGGTHGFLLSGGVYTTLDAPGAISTEAYGINDAGQIVGQYSDNTGGTHGFLLSGGSYTTLDVPGATAPRLMESTTPARSWDGTRLLKVSTPTASCGTPGVTPRSTCPAQSEPAAGGSTTPARSWDIILVSEEAASC